MRSFENFTNGMAINNHSINETNLNVKPNLETFVAMRKFLLVFLLIPLFSFNVYCQSGALNEIRDWLKHNGYKILPEQVANLKQGESAHHSRTFYKEYEYVIIGLSDDDDVTDVDLFLQRMDGTEFDKDDDSDDSALINFDPTFTREMKVVIKNYSSRTPNYASKCRIIIAYK